MLSHVLKVALLLMGSGACALIYQTVWLRELRLIFGASTPASAAVLAIFMGGLGGGGLLFGRRVDRHPRPLALYAWLELGIASSAAITPFLLQVARSLYVAMGGTLRLGLHAGTLLRLLLAALILSIPTLLMGATLPAAGRAVATQLDTRRRSLAVLYGMNTLGAVVGTALSTFYLLERLGNRRTLWLACLLNLAVAGIAFFLTRRLHPRLADSVAASEPPPASSTVENCRADARFVLLAAALVGASFLLMELVWYRMLGPLLGGSSFSFGLILAVALLGIGIGGLAYSLRDERQPATLGGFALTSVLLAVNIAVPYALGDRVALLAAALRALNLFGFSGQVLGWTCITALVVLPAAIVSGIQFPLLIGLLGRGRDQVGRQVGLAYAWNTAGAIGGSLLGGFGLLPLLSALGTWRLVVCLLAALGVVAALLSLGRDGSRRQVMLPLSGALGAALLVAGSGPTAIWRHSGIGAGRADLPDDSGAYNSRRDWEHSVRRAISWQADGVESSVAISTVDALAFVVNGKSDGSTRGDAPTFLMGGLLGAILHEQPRRALVIGLGTGITAGWLGAVPSIERVEVVELEPAIRNVARASALVNRSVFDNSKVHVAIGDGREVLLTDTRSYDLIVSQPSNPYRAGVASLFTKEYYRSARARLAAGGLFLQWLQAYEVDNKTVRTIYATLASEFPAVETWLTQPGDLLLIGSLSPIEYPVARLRQRITEEPYRSALRDILRTSDLEGVMGHFVGGSALARDIARMSAGSLNTDDRNEVEFTFARSAGSTTNVDLQALLELSHARSEDLPALRGGEVDVQKVVARRISLYTLTNAAAPVLSYLNAEQQQRARLQRVYTQGDLEAAIQIAITQPWDPHDLIELSMFADLFVQAQHERALELITQLRTLQPTEADALQGLWHLRRREIKESAAALEAAFRSLHHDPWTSRTIMKRALRSLPELVAQDKTLGPRFYGALAAPFAVFVLNEDRLGALVNLAAALDDSGYCQDALTQIGAHIFWQEPFLRWRLACHRRAGRRGMAAQAEQDLNLFLAHQAPPLVPEVPAKEP